jgi:hypothetical protein
LVLVEALVSLHINPIVFLEAQKLLVAVALAVVQPAQTALTHLGLEMAAAVAPVIPQGLAAVEAMALFPAVAAVVAERALIALTLALAALAALVLFVFGAGDNDLRSA